MEGAGLCCFVYHSSSLPFYSLVASYLFSRPGFLQVGSELFLVG